MHRQKDIRYTHSYHYQSPPKSEKKVDESLQSLYDSFRWLDLYHVHSYANTPLKQELTPNQGQTIGEGTKYEK